MSTEGKSPKNLDVKHISIGLIFLLFLILIIFALNNEYKIESLNFNGFGIEFDPPESTPTITPTPTVEIIIPTSGDIVHSSITVEGTASNVPKNSSLWVFVRHEKNNNIYPSGGRIPISQDNKWHVETWLNKSGMKYEICAALADERADEELQNYANTRKEKGYPGILFPKGFTVYSTVNVTQE